MSGRDFLFHSLHSVFSGLAFHPFALAGIGANPLSSSNASAGGVGEVVDIG